MGDAQRRRPDVLGRDRKRPALGVGIGTTDGWSECVPGASVFYESAGE
jgi:hypothetical protein